MREPRDQEEREHRHGCRETPPQQADADGQAAPRIDHAEPKACEAPERHSGTNAHVQTHVAEERPHRCAIGVPRGLDAEPMKPRPSESQGADRERCACNEAHGSRKPPVALIRAVGGFEEGYRWGTERKLAMLGWEAARALGADANEAEVGSRALA